MSQITNAIQRIFDGYCLEPDDSMALTRAKSAIEELERENAELVEMIGRDQREYNRKTNRMIQRHAAQIVELKQRIEALNPAASPTKTA